MFKPLRRLLFGSKNPTAADLAARLKDKPIETITAELGRRHAELEHTLVRIGLIGATGAGKSSLINAVFGRKLAPVGAVTVQHSAEGEEYEINGVKLVDLPGIGGVQHPAATYMQDLKLLEPGRYDAFLLVTAHRLTENDVALFNELHVKGGKPFFVVRTHFDAAIGTTGGESAARTQIEAFFRQHLPLEPAERIYMVSAPTPERYDLPLLLADISASLPELKQLRVLEVIPAYTEDLLRKKREAVEELVFIQATLAAANGLNPIPGLDIAVDMKIIQKMTHQVVSAFGLTREQLESLSKTTVGGVTLDRLLDVAAPVTSRLATAGVMTLFKEATLEAAKKTGGKFAVREGTGMLFRYGARFAPVVGQLVSAGVNFSAAYLYGKFLLNECEDTTRKIIAELPRQVTAVPGE